MRPPPPSLLVGALLLGFAALPILLRASRDATKRKRGKTGSFCVGVDIGGSTVKAALVDARSGARSASLVRALPPGKTPEETVRVTGDLLLEMLDSQSLVPEPACTLFVGVSIPGRVDEAAGVVSTAANLGAAWNELPLADALEKSLVSRFKDQISFKVKIINDASAALYGELWSGSARGCRDCVLLTLGTGVGAAVCTDGRCLRGATGMFGEMGHSIIDLNGKDTRFSRATGVYGILEEYASSRGLVQAYGAPGLNAEAVFARARSGADERATRVVDAYFDSVGVSVINAARCYDPSVIVLAGGVVEAGDWFMDRAKAAARARHWTLAPPTFELRPATHGQFAGCVGAAFVAVNS